MVWNLNKLGLFTVSSAYQLVRQLASKSMFLAILWHSLLPIKVLFFMLWLLEFQLPLMDVLYHFRIHGPSNCLCCCNPDMESVNQIFCTGDLSKYVWQLFEGMVGRFSSASTVWHVLAQW